jgi:hypothetical protein
MADRASEQNAESVQQGVEVITKQNHRPVAVIKTPQSTGRLLSELAHGIARLTHVRGVNAAASSWTN